MKTKRTLLSVLPIIMLATSLLFFGIGYYHSTHQPAVTSLTASAFHKGITVDTLKALAVSQNEEFKNLAQVWWLTLLFAYFSTAALIALFGAILLYVVLSLKQLERKGGALQNY